MSNVYPYTKIFFPEESKMLSQIGYSTNPTERAVFVVSQMIDKKIVENEIQGLIVVDEYREIVKEAQNKAAALNIPFTIQASMPLTFTAFLPHDQRSAQRRYCR